MKPLMDVIGKLSVSMRSDKDLSLKFGLALLSKIVNFFGSFFGRVEKEIRRAVLAESGLGQEEKKAARLRREPVNRLLLA